MQTKFVFAALVVGASLPLAAEAQRATRIDLGTPEGVMTANRKIQCSTRDEVPVTYWWHGDMYSRVPGERDRLVFRVEGMNVRQCTTIRDAEKGTGFKMVSRELLFYRDPETGELVRTWKNPWTGESVEVIQTANDPVNSTWWPVGRDGKPVRWTGGGQGNHWWLNITVPLFYRNPLGGDYQEYVGGMYHATEMFNFFGNLDDLTEPRRDTAETRIGWVRISGWLPWMKMGDRPGTLYFHTAGRKLASWDDMPERMRRDIEANFPDYRQPPPVDDTRPNETSWTYFRKQVPPAKSGQGGH